ncbi:MAG TPA: nucleoside recognition domain-containing protein [Polyangiaceae bacterium]|nr:nucleoside recognition domain-containing protein [Polyangiaceae bacterium]
MSADALTSIVLVGLESVGKSAIFRGLTGHATGDEANFRGSTVVCRRCHLKECGCELVDTPGIRLEGDSATTMLALETLGVADAVMLVVRAPYLTDETRALLRTVRLGRRRLAIVITFADKVSAELASAMQKLRTRLGVPVVAVDARAIHSARSELFDAIRDARPLAETHLEDTFVQLRARPPARTIFEHRSLGPWAALGAMAGLLALPVACAFHLAAWLQAAVDATAIDPITRALTGAWPPLVAILVGPYGLMTLGSYSFLWAFPVVLLLSMTSSLAEETGLHDRITSALDPWLRHVGLSGRDLVPVLTGFGCNVVAVLHSRACSSCSRKACVSLVAFGSACSYQIGASLSLFGSAGRSWMFAPYLVGVFVVGLVHTRVWHGALAHHAALPLQERAYLQSPTARAVLWRVGSVLKQFLLQAMPIFLGLCVICSLLEQTGALRSLSVLLGPCARLFRLPTEIAPAVLLSIPRKDGMLLLNADGGALLRTLSAGQLFVVVYLASTLTPCLVTLAAIARELGWRTAGAVAGRQALTSLVSASVFSLLAAQAHPSQYVQLSCIYSWLLRGHVT